MKVLIVILRTMFMLKFELQFVLSRIMMPVEIFIGTIWFLTKNIQAQRDRVNLLTIKD